MLQTPYIKFFVYIQLFVYRCNELWFAIEKSPKPRQVLGGNWRYIHIIVLNDRLFFISWCIDLYIDLNLTIVSKRDSIAYQYIISFAWTFRTICNHDVEGTRERGAIVSSRASFSHALWQIIVHYMCTFWSHFVRFLFSIVYLFRLFALSFVQLFRPLLIAVTWYNYTSL